MKALADIPYDASMIEAIFEAWPKILAARMSGNLRVDFTPERPADLSDKVAANKIYTILPRASRVLNTLQQLDDSLSVFCDVDNAFKACVSERQREVFMRRYLQGFSLDEVAEIYSVTPQAIDQMCQRAFIRMAKWLEEPTVATPAHKAPDKLPPRKSIHDRIYSSDPLAFQH